MPLKDDVKKDLKNFRERDVIESRIDEEDIAEEDIQFCDGCHKEVSTEEVLECPSSWEEGEHGETYYRRFCDECCKSVYNSEGCQNDVLDCPRAGSIFVEKLNEYALSKGFEESTKHCGVFFGKSRIYCISSFKIEPENVFADKRTSLNHDEMFDGEKGLIVKRGHAISMYGKEPLTEVKRVLDELGFFSFSYDFLQKSRILVIDGYGAWGAIAPLDATAADPSVEKERFVERTMRGAKFFGIESTKDDLLVLKPSKIRIDWSKIDDRKFVELCRDILHGFPRVKEVNITHGSGEADFGQDIEMIEDITDLTSERKQRWAIQCKHFQSRAVNKSDLKLSSFDAYARFNYDVYCVMTSGLISPGCIQFLKSIEQNPKFGIKVCKYDKKDLEDLVRARPDLYATYFG